MKGGGPQGESCLGKNKPRTKEKLGTRSRLIGLEEWESYRLWRSQPSAGLTILWDVGGLGGPLAK